MIGHRDRIRRRSRPPGTAEQGFVTAEQGFVTAETAMVLPTLVGLGLALALIVIAAADQLRCSDAAWEAARALARGETPGVAQHAAPRLGPAGATVFVDTADGSVLVRVSARLALAGALVPVLHVDGRAQVSCEPGTPCAGDGIGEQVR
jgi:hypothetical protein